MKYVLITGARGGMGAAAVKCLADMGYGVFALDKSPAGEKINGVTPLEADVTNPQSLLLALAKVSAVTDRLFAIVHFAGIYCLDSLIEMDEAAFKRAFDINLFGVFNVNKAFMPLLKSGSRVIITTSELAPLAPLPFTGIYAITKSALDKYAYSLLMELQLLGISVSVVRAGAVDTGMLSVSTAALDRFCSTTALYKCNARNFKRIVDGVEAKRVPPQRIAGKVCKILMAKKPRFAYSINRNPLLLLLNALPSRLRLFIIRRILA